MIFWKKKIKCKAKIWCETEADAESLAALTNGVPTRLAEYLLPSIHGPSATMSYSDAAGLMQSIVQRKFQVVPSGAKDRSGFYLIIE